MKSPYYKSKVLVTGGCGFIGSHLVDELIKQGAVVTVLDNTSKNPYKNRKAAYISKDIIDKNLFKLDSAFEYIFHLAARCDLDGKALSDYRVNYDGTENLLKQLNHQTIKRFVFYSTQLVVGLFNETRFIGPEEPYKTKTLYGESKILGEKVVKNLCMNKQIPFVIIRPTSVYGPRGREPYRSFFLSLKNGHYRHIGKASNLVSLAYVKNLVDLTLLTAIHPQAIGQVFYGTDFHPYTMRQFTDEVAKYFNYQVKTLPEWLMWLVAYIFGTANLLGINVPIYPFRLKNLLSNYCYSIQNAVRLGYDPQFDLKSGVKQTLEWYIKNDSDFKT